MTLAAHLLVMTNNFTKIDDYKVLSSFIGIVPYQYESGKSVHKRALKAIINSIGKARDYSIAINY